MNKNLSVERLDEVRTKLLAPVIRMKPDDRKTKRHLEDLTRTKSQKVLPSFYTSPIFKPKVNDPL